MTDLRRGLFVSFVVLGLACACSQIWAASPNNLILINGRVYTSDPKSRWAEAVAIKGGVITYIGSNAGAKSKGGHNARQIDLGGRLLLPGIIDPHDHLMDRALALFSVDMGNQMSEHTLEEYRRRIQEYRARNLNLQQVFGKGYDSWILPAIAQSRKRQPRALLDDIVSDVPAAFIAWTNHQVWANSKAIELAGITKDTPNPLGAEIGRDPATGEPNGLFYERAAHNLIISKLPEPDFSVEQYRAGILSWQKDVAAKRGVTGAVVPAHSITPNFFPAMQQLSDEGLLTARYSVAQLADEIRGVEQIPELVANRNRFRGGRYFHLDTIKVFAPWPQDSLNREFAALDKLGFRIFVHNVGSTASYASVLDAFEYALKQNGSRDSRHIISHVRAEAAPLAMRFKALGIHADSDWHPAPKSYYEAGVPTTLSSDYPVRDPAPLAKMTEGVKSGLSLDDLIDSATIRGAEDLFAEKLTGSITVGKVADLVVFDRDFFKIAPDDIANAKPLLTLFAGKEVYRDPSF